MTARPCSMCGTATDTTYHICPPCRRATGAAECARQGVEHVITDPVRLARIARIVRTPALTAPAATVPTRPSAGAVNGGTPDPTSSTATGGTAAPPANAGRSTSPHS
jgi:hypothetical protein